MTNSKDDILEQSLKKQREIGMRIRTLQNEAKLSQEELANKVQLDRAVLSRIENGTRPIRDTELIKLSHVFEVSSDYILGNSNKKHYYDLTEKDERNIDNELEDMMNGLDSKNSLSFFKNGAELSDDDKELLKASMRQTLELSKQLAKRKFTPKKYRHGEE